MSVRSNGSGDKLTVASSWGVSTGLFSVGFWVKLITDRDDFSGLVGMGDTNADPTTNWVATTTGDGVTLTLYSSGNQLGGTLAYALSVGTWYWVVVARDAAPDLLYRVFDDSTSTTPVASAVGSADWTDNFSSVDNFVIGQLMSGEWSDAEFANVKVHNGVAWTNAQCRTESQQFEIQTGGGTIWGSWRLEDVDADTDGLQDGSGNGRHLSNTGFVAGSSRPDQLESVGSIASCAGTLRGGHARQPGAMMGFAPLDQFLKVSFRGPA